MPRRFHRIEADKKIAGVCTGLSEYFNLDVTLVRVLFVVFGLGGGTAILLYLILWAVAPSRPHTEGVGARPPGS